MIWLLVSGRIMIVDSILEPLKDENGSVPLKIKIPFLRAESGILFGVFLKLIWKEFPSCEEAQKRMGDFATGFWRHPDTDSRSYC